MFWLLLNFLWEKIYFCKTRKEYFRTFFYPFILRDKRFIIIAVQLWIFDTCLQCWEQKKSTRKTRVKQVKNAHRSVSPFWILFVLNNSFINYPCNEKLMNEQCSLGNAGKHNKIGTLLRCTGFKIIPNNKNVLDGSVFIYQFFFVAYLYFFVINFDCFYCKINTDRWTLVWGEISFRKLSNEAGFSNICITNKDNLEQIAIVFHICAHVERIVLLRIIYHSANGRWIFPKSLSLSS